MINTKPEIFLSISGFSYIVIFTLGESFSFKHLIKAYYNIIYLSISYDCLLSVYEGLFDAWKNRLQNRDEIYNHITHPKMQAKTPYV